MAVILWDASALSKRYAPEVGTDVVDALFDAAGMVTMCFTATGYAEVFSILLRRYNRNQFSAPALRDARSALRADILTHGRFRLLSMDDETTFAGLPLIDAHNLNATDAAILALYLNFVKQNSDAGPHYLVASDKRLLRAADVEGLRTLNPEDSRVEDVRSLLRSL